MVTKTENQKKNFFPEDDYIEFIKKLENMYTMYTRVDNLVIRIIHLIRTQNFPKN